SCGCAGSSGVLELTEHRRGVVEHVVAGVAAEVVAPRVRLALAPAILLPGVAGVVVGVAVELDGQAELRPAAVDAALAGDAVGVRERQAVLAEQLEEAVLEVAQGHAGVTEEDGAELCRAGGVRAALQDGGDVARGG